MSEKLNFVRDDGGRAALGMPGSVGDCVVRAIAIAAERPYLEVYTRIKYKTGRVRHSKRRPSPENGIVTTQPWFKVYMAELGFRFISSSVLPNNGRLVVETIDHAFAVVAVDGEFTVHDTHMRRAHDPRRGYWIKRLPGVKA